MIAAHCLSRQVFDLVGIHVDVDFVVHCDGEGLIAASKTAYVFHLHIFGAQAGKATQEFGAEFAGTVEMATHVVAKARLCDDMICHLNGSCELRAELLRRFSSLRPEDVQVKDVAVLDAAIRPSPSQ